MNGMILIANSLYWYNYLNNNTIADAILDRIIHSSHRVELSGPSMRKIKSSIKNEDY